MTLTETQRGWLYVGAILIGVAAVIFGVATVTDVSTIITGIVLVLTGGLATKNTLLKNTPMRIDPRDDPEDRGAVTLWTIVAVLAIAVLIVLLVMFVNVDIRGK